MLKQSPVMMLSCTVAPSDPTDHGGAVHCAVVELRTDVVAVACEVLLEKRHRMGVAKSIP